MPAVTRIGDADVAHCSGMTRAVGSPDVFANGGDRKGDNVPEVALCKELGIEMMWNCGGGKIQSSSDLVAKQKEAK